MSDLPQMMKAVEITKPGLPEVLKLCERPVPVPASGEVLIKVHYAGINRPDVLQRTGNYNPPRDASDLPGLECSGTIEAVGVGVSRWSVGDEVCALLPGGGYAQYVTTPAAHVLPVPQGMSLAQAAALPETYFTVWSNVFMRGGLTAGQSFLVHGGASGIGTTAIQLASAYGARVFTTAGSAEKCEFCQELGAEYAVNYRSMDFGGIIRDLTDDRGVDMILDMVGGQYIPRNIKLLAMDGTLIQIAFLSGPSVEVNFAHMMVKRLTITGSTLRPQSVAAKAEIARQLEEKVWPLLSAGRIEPIMDHVFALKDAHNAHKRMENSAHIGKMILKVD